MFSLLSNVFPIEIEGSGDSMPKSLLFVSNQLSCKTSLLFQMIQSLVLDSYEDIHYIVSQKMSKIPDPIQGMTQIDLNNGSVYHFVKVYYLSTYESLINHLKALDKSNNLCPVAIIIDDVNHYIKDWPNGRKIERQGDNEAKIKRFKRSDKDDKQLMAELTAFLISVGNSCRKRINKHTLVIMGYNLKDSSNKELNAIESIGQRFYDNVWSLRKTSTDNTDGSTVYELDCKSNQNKLKLNLSLDNNEIVLNSIASKK